MQHTRGSSQRRSVLCFPVVLHQASLTYCLPSNILLTSVGEQDRKHLDRISRYQRPRAIEHLREQPVTQSNTTLHHLLT